MGKTLARKKLKWMKRNMAKTKRISWILLSALILGAVLLGLPGRAFAQLGINSVQPNVVSNTTAVQLVVTGSEFADGAVVVLDNFGALDTNFVSATVLTAFLPAGLPAGAYGLTVINPDSTSAYLANAVTIVVVTQTPSGPAEVTPTPYARPLIVVSSYTISTGKVPVGQAFTVTLRLKNTGERTATNITAKFESGTLVPLQTGGLVSLQELDPGETHKLIQDFAATYDVYGKSVVTEPMVMNYTDESGTAYTQEFTLSLPVASGGGVLAATKTPTPTVTPTPRPRPLLVISSYQTDVPVLQPGNLFTLQLQVQNVGNSNARRVTMILGGGSGTSGSGGDTPVPGGVSGSSGDYTVFAPVGSSNVQFLGDVPAGVEKDLTAKLIVNATANPGAYPLKISFVYSGDDDTTYTDDQVVTLLVYSLPQMNVSFYRDPGVMFAGQENQIPLQIVNLGKKSSVLGNMRVTAVDADGNPTGDLTNNTILVGNLDPGGYYTLDANLIPYNPGPLDLQISVDYTDDFNQPQVITDTLQVQVEAAQVVEPGSGEGLPPGSEQPVVAAPETLWQKLIRLVKGLIGLDSSLPATPVEPLPNEVPPGETVPLPPAGKPPMKG